MKISIILVQAILFVLNCKSQTNFYSEVIADFKPKHSIKIYFTDYFDNTSAPISLADNDIIKLRINRPIYIREATDQQNQILIYPNEQVRVRYFDGKFHFEANNILRNAELNIFPALLDSLKTYSFNSLKMNWQDSNLIAKNFRTINQKYAEIVSFLEYYTTKHELADSFLNSTQKFFLYSSLLAKIPLYSNSFTFNKYGTLQKVEIENSSLFLNKDSLLYMETYRSFVLSYIMLKAEVSYLSPKTDFAKLMYLSQKYLTGDTYDYAIFYFAKKMIIFNLATNEIMLLITSLNNYRFKEYLESNLRAKSNTIQFDQDIILNQNNEKYVLDDLIKSFNGKFIYLDFWASWCSPCLKEIPEGINMAANNKELKYILISLDDDFSKWKTAQKQLGIATEQSYFLTGNFNSAIAKKLGIISIPRYVLIGKDGNIISLDAPRPSDIQLTSQKEKHQQNNLEN
jgi:thiol-disulfide isomerase/thioredoxin